MSDPAIEQARCRISRERVRDRVSFALVAAGFCGLSRCVAPPWSVTLLWLAGLTVLAWVGVECVHGWALRELERLEEKNAGSA